MSNREADASSDAARAERARPERTALGPDQVLRRKHLGPPLGKGDDVHAKLPRPLEDILQGHPHLALELLSDRIDVVPEAGREIAMRAAAVPQCAAHRTSHLVLEVGERHIQLLRLEVPPPSRIDPGAEELRGDQPGPRLGRRHSAMFLGDLGLRFGEPPVEMAYRQISWRPPALRHVELAAPCGLVIAVTASLCDVRAKARKARPKVYPEAMLQASQGRNVWPRVTTQDSRHRVVIHTRGRLDITQRAPSDGGGELAAESLSGPSCRVAVGVSIRPGATGHVFSRRPAHGAGHAIDLRRRCHRLAVSYGVESIRHLRVRPMELLRLRFVGSGAPAIASIHHRPQGSDHSHA